MRKLIEIYTDGSCSTNTRQGGWGYVVVIDDREAEVAKGASEDTTNNQMEMTAMIEAMRMMSERDIKEYRIYTDSAYICNCFKQGWWINWKANGWRTSNRVSVKNKELWEELISFYESNTIEILKVAAHGTNRWNNRADALAQSWRTGK